jgi:hypothetical protein
MALLHEEDTYAKQILCDPGFVKTQVVARHVYNQEGWASYAGAPHVCSTLKLGLMMAIHAVPGLKGVGIKSGHSVEERLIRF